jgi:hypothetical protein
MSNPLKTYLKRLTIKERQAFAERAGSSDGSLRLAANGYKTSGKLVISPAFAARLEEASGGVLKREQLSEACALCPYALGCA